MTWEEKLDHTLFCLTEGKGTKNLLEICQRDLHVGADEQQRIIDWLLEDGLIERQDSKGEQYSITFQGRYKIKFGGGYQALTYSPAHRRRVANESPTIREMVSTGIKKAKDGLASWFHTTATSR